MLGIRGLKLLYALVGLLFASFWTEKLIAAHFADHIPFSVGTFYCILLFVSVPALGYILLFKLFPLAGRFLKR
jgi:hypothetical protein